MSSADVLSNAAVEPDELIARAAELFDLLRENAPRANSERRLPDENVEAMREAGLLRTLNPRRYGGHEADFKTQMEVTAELARACPSSGWVASLLTSCQWYAGLLPDRAQDEIFGADPDALVCGVVSPGPTPATPVEGGFEVSGRWGFASGCLHATWAYVPAPVVEDGETVDLVLCFVPISSLAIEDTWHVMGMRGTGSNTLVGERLFVPEHRTLRLFGPDGVLAGNVRNEHSEETLYRAPLGMVSGTLILGPCLGIARAARDHALAKLPHRAIAFSVYTKSSAAISTQMAVADAHTHLDMATMLAHRSADDCTAAGRPGGRPSPTLRARTRHDAAYAAQLLKGVVDSFLEVTGASSTAESDLMQQLYRDISTASLHAVLQTASTLELYGAGLCGEQPKNTFLL